MVSIPELPGFSKLHELSASPVLSAGETFVATVVSRTLSDIKTGATPLGVTIQGKFVQVNLPEDIKAGDQVLLGVVIAGADPKLEFLERAPLIEAGNLKQIIVEKLIKELALTDSALRTLRVALQEAEQTSRPSLFLTLQRQTPPTPGAANSWPHTQSSNNSATLLQKMEQMGIVTEQALSDPEKLVTLLREPRHVLELPKIIQLRKTIEAEEAKTPLPQYADLIKLIDNRAEKLLALLEERAATSKTTSRTAQGAVQLQEQKSNQHADKTIPPLPPQPPEVERMVTFLKSIGNTSNTPQFAEFREIVVKQLEMLNGIEPQLKNLLFSSPLQTPVSQLRETLRTVEVAPTATDSDADRNFKSFIKDLRQEIDSLFKSEATFTVLLKKALRVALQRIEREFANTKESVATESPQVTAANISVPRGPSMQGARDPTLVASPLKPEVRSPQHPDQAHSHEAIIPSAVPPSSEGLSPQHRFVVNSIERQMRQILKMELLNEPALYKAFFNSLGDLIELTKSVDTESPITGSATEKRFFEFIRTISAKFSSLVENQEPPVKIRQFVEKVLEQIGREFAESDLFEVVERLDLTPHTKSVAPSLSPTHRELLVTLPQMLESTINSLEEHSNDSKLLRQIIQSEAATFSDCLKVILDEPTTPALIKKYIPALINRLQKLPELSLEDSDLRPLRDSYVKLTELIPATKPRHLETLLTASAATPPSSKLLEERLLKFDRALQDIFTRNEISDAERALLQQGTARAPESSPQFSEPAGSGQLPPTELRNGNVLLDALRKDIRLLVKRALVTLPEIGTPAEEELRETISQLETVSAELDQRPAPEIRHELLKIRDSLRARASNRGAKGSNKDPLEELPLSTISAVEQMANAQDTLAKLSPLLEATGDPTMILFPTILQGLISSLEIKRLGLYDQSSRAKDGSDSGNQKKDSGRDPFERIEVSFELPAMGRVSIDLAHRREELLINFSFEEPGCAAFIEKRFARLGEALRRIGYTSIQALCAQRPAKSSAPRGLRV